VQEPCSRVACIKKRGGHEGAGGKKQRPCSGPTRSQVQTPRQQVDGQTVPRVDISSGWCCKGLGRRRRRGLTIAPILRKSATLKYCKQTTSPFSGPTTSGSGGPPTTTLSDVEPSATAGCDDPRKCASQPRNEKGVTGDDLLSPRGGDERRVNSSFSSSDDDSLGDESEGAVLERRC
jgi:hypothetical protein